MVANRALAELRLETVPLRSGISGDCCRAAPGRKINISADPYCQRRQAE
jgi:hypothetical protein